MCGLRFTGFTLQVLLKRWFYCVFQAEELNSIVGNAFRMAYAAQLQRQPAFRDVIASQLQDFPDSDNNNCTDSHNWVNNI